MMNYTKLLKLRMGNKMKKFNKYFISFRWDKQEKNGPLCTGFGNSTINYIGEIKNIRIIRDIEDELCLDNKVDRVIILNYIKLK